MDFDGKRIGKEKNWRKKLEKDVDEALKIILKQTCGAKFIERAMKSFNKDINGTNVYKMEI